MINMEKEVFIYTEWIKYSTKIEKVIAGHLRNGWKMEGFSMSGTSLVVIIFSRMIVVDEQR